MCVWFSLTEWRTYQFKLPHPPPRGDIGPLSIPREIGNLTVIQVGWGIETRTEVLCTFQTTLFLCLSWPTDMFVQNRRFYKKAFCFFFFFFSERRR